MNKESLIEDLANRLGTTKIAARETIDAIFGSREKPGIIEARVQRGHEVTISGFGVFGVKATAPRSGRNPATGETIAIPAGRKATFRYSGALKSRVSGKG